MSERTCGNSYCTCAVQGAEFCCDACGEQTRRNEPAPCLCGHADCGGTVPPSLPEG